jgi:hypothetical protein
MRKTMQTVAGAVLLMAVSTVQGAATVWTYDENTVQANTVDASAAFASGTGAATAVNVITVGSFKSSVESAAPLGFGGVLNFDSQISTDDQVATTGIANSFPLVYGGGLKSLALSYSTSDSVLAFRQGNLSNRTPISAGNGSTPGFAMTVRNELTAGSSSLIFNFGTITGGMPLEGVTSAGFTFLSRASRDFGSVAATATFSDGSTVTASATIPTSQGNGDTFYGFLAPSGASISSVSLDTGTNIEYSIDDLGFVTTIIPEPTSLALIGLGALVMLRRSRV